MGGRCNHDDGSHGADSESLAAACGSKGFSSKVIDAMSPRVMTTKPAVMTTQPASSNRGGGRATATGATSGRWTRNCWTLHSIRCSRTGGLAAPLRNPTAAAGSAAPAAQKATIAAATIFARDVPSATVVTPQRSQAELRRSVFDSSPSRFRIAATMGTSQ